MIGSDSFKSGFYTEKLETIENAVQSYAELQSFDSASFEELDAAKESTSSLLSAMMTDSGMSGREDSFISIDKEFFDDRALNQEKLEEFEKNIVLYYALNDVKWTFFGTTGNLSSLSEAKMKDEQTSMDELLPVEIKRSHSKEQIRKKTGKTPDADRVYIYPDGSVSKEQKRQAKKVSYNSLSDEHGHLWQTAYDPALKVDSASLQAGFNPEGHWEPVNPGQHSQEDSDSSTGADDPVKLGVSYLFDKTKGQFILLDPENILLDGVEEEYYSAAGELYGARSVNKEQTITNIKDLLEKTGIEHISEMVLKDLDEKSVAYYKEQFQDFVTPETGFYEHLSDESSLMLDEVQERITRHQVSEKVFETLEKASLYGLDESEITGDGDLISEVERPLNIFENESDFELVLQSPEGAEFFDIHPQEETPAEKLAVYDVNRAFKEVVPEKRQELSNAVVHIIKNYNTLYKDFNVEKNDLLTFAAKAVNSRKKESREKGEASGSGVDNSSRDNLVPPAATVAAPGSNVRESGIEHVAAETESGIEPGTAGYEFVSPSSEQAEKKSGEENNSLSPETRDVDSGAGANKAELTAGTVGEALDSPDEKQETAFFAEEKLKETASFEKIAQEAGFSSGDSLTEDSYEEGLEELSGEFSAIIDRTITREKPVTDLVREFSRDSFDEGFLLDIIKPEPIETAQPEDFLPRWQEALKQTSLAQAAIDSVVKKVSQLSIPGEKQKPFFRALQNSFANYPVIAQNAGITPSELASEVYNIVVRNTPSSRIENKKVVVSKSLPEVLMDKAAHHKETTKEFLLGKNAKRRMPLFKNLNLLYNRDVDLLTSSVLALTEDSTISAVIRETGELLKNVQVPLEEGERFTDDILDIVHSQKEQSRGQELEADSLKARVAEYIQNHNYTRSAGKKAPGQLTSEKLAGNETGTLKKKGGTPSKELPVVKAKPVLPVADLFDEEQKRVFSAGYEPVISGDALNRLMDGLLDEERMISHSVELPLSFHEKEGERAPLQTSYKEVHHKVVKSLSAEKTVVIAGNEADKTGLDLAYTTSGEKTEQLDEARVESIINQVVPEHRRTDFSYANPYASLLKKKAQAQKNQTGQQQMYTNPLPQAQNQNSRDTSSLEEEKMRRINQNYVHDKQVLARSKTENSESSETPKKEKNGTDKIVVTAEELIDTVKKEIDESIF